MRFGLGHALHAVATGLETQFAPGAFAFDGEDHFLEAADFGRCGVEILDLPALALEVAPVDAVQVGCEQRGFVAAGAGANLDDHLAAQVFGVGDQGVLDLFRELFLERFDQREILACELDEFGFGRIAEDPFGLHAAFDQRVETLRERGGGFEQAALLQQGRQALAIGSDRLRAEHLRQLVEARGSTLQLRDDHRGKLHDVDGSNEVVGANSSKPLDHVLRAAADASAQRDGARRRVSMRPGCAALHRTRYFFVVPIVPYFLTKRSTRPAESTNFCLPE